MVVKSNLKVIMAKKKISSLSELQRLTGISRPIIYRIADDELIRKVTFDKLITVCEAIGCEFDELVIMRYEDANR